MTETKKRQKRKPGNIVEIKLTSGEFCYGRELLYSGVIAFYDTKSRTRLRAEDVIGRAILFKLPVMDYAIKKAQWPIIGWRELEPELMNPIAFFIQDSINGEFSIYCEGGKIVPATPEEIVGLESAFVWDPGHVEDR